MALPPARQRWSAKNDLAHLERREIWRERAALIRTTALTAKDQATLDLMCDLAGDCDKFADKAALKAHADNPKGGRKTL
jgi:hypothetical protein